jgi:hypothetical protein
MSFTVNLRDDLPDEIKDLIARISVRHGQLEHVLTMTIKRTSPSRSLSEATARAQYLLNQPAFTEEAMQTYGKDTDDQEVEAEFLEVLDRAREASSARRDVDHALWAYDEQGNLVWLRNGVTMDISTLSSIHKNLEDAVRDLNAQTGPQDPFISTGGH